MVSLQHGGFLVPNAGGEGVLPRMAEVDQIDFNTLSQPKWAVVEGCRISVASTTASTTGGVALVDGVLVNVKAGGTVSLGIGLEMDRFDLIGVDVSGNLVKVGGKPSFDPVFPDPPDTVTVLAAVFCPTGAGNLSTYVIDKRVMTPRALLSNVNSDQQLLRNVQIQNDAMSDLFSIQGGGRITWHQDTALYREDVATLRLQDNINITGKLQVDGDAVALNFAARNLVTGLNLVRGNALTGFEPKGALRQATDGRLYLNGPEGWVEIATIDSTSPVGTIIQSVEIPTKMPKGWVQLGGDTVSESLWPNLFGLDKLRPFIVSPPEIPVGQRSMRLPDMTNRILMGTKGDPTEGGSNNRALSLANLPSHSHSVKIDPDGAYTPTGVTVQNGGHTHTQLALTGDHIHNVVDPGHQHNGAEIPGGRSGVVTAFWGGTNKLDAEFNDRNHTWSVEVMDWSAPAITSVAIGRSGSEHKHDLEPVLDHTHEIRMDRVVAHSHAVTESLIGTNAPVDVRQAYFSVYMYIRA